jgi:hypothetical protein
MHITIVLEPPTALADWLLPPKRQRTPDMPNPRPITLICVAPTALTALGCTAVTVASSTYSNSRGKPSTELPLHCTTNILRPASLLTLSHTPNKLLSTLKRDTDPDPNTHVDRPSFCRLCPNTDTTVPPLVGPELGSIDRTSASVSYMYSSAVEL